MLDELMNPVEVIQNAVLATSWLISRRMVAATQCDCIRLRVANTPHANLLRRRELTVEAIFEATPVKSKILVLLSLVVLASGTIMADEIRLKNGDHLTGSIVKLDDGKLSVSTDFADVMVIKWSAVSEISSDQTLFIQKTDKSQVSASRLSVLDHE